MDERIIIARNIKKMREVSNYTPENVAAFLGVNRSAYSNYELGTRELPLECMDATAFRVDDLNPEDMEQIAAFKRVVKNSLMMDLMLAK